MLNAFQRAADLWVNHLNLDEKVGQTNSKLVREESKF